MAIIIISIALCLIIGYFFGCISTAYIIGKRQGIDIREHGSNSAGATNALRTLGKKAGIIVFLGDCIKAVVAILIMLLARNLSGIELDTETITLATGLGAVLGHNFPFWLGFKGGKGIAVTSSVILAFCLPNMWICPLVCVILFALIVKTTRYVSLGSLTVVSTFLLYVGITYMNDANFIRLFVLTFCFTALAFYMHRANIKRLLNGTENKFGAKKEDKDAINKNNKVHNQNQNYNQNNANMNNQNYNQNNANMNNQNYNLNNANVNNNYNQNYNPNAGGINNVFMQPSDLVNGNIDDLNSNSGKNNNSFGGETSNLYNTQYFDQVEKFNKQENVNNNNFNSNAQNEFYQDYSDCDTMDETRLLDESELNEDNGYSPENPYR